MIPNIKGTDNIDETRNETTNNNIIDGNENKHTNIKRGRPIINRNKTHDSDKMVVKNKYIIDHNECTNNNTENNNN